MDISNLEKRDLEVLQFLINNEEYWYTSNAVKDELEYTHAARSLKKLYNKGLLLKLDRGNFLPLYAVTKNLGVRKNAEN